jgi:hypothetical protein
MAAPRCPRQIHDPEDRTTDVAGAVDTDADGRPDTLVRDDGVDLILLTDLDGDGYAERMLRIGPDGSAREAGYRPEELPDELVVEPAAGWGGD